MKITKLFLVLFLVLIGFVTVNSVMDHSFADNEIQNDCQKVADSTFSVGIIGDSWVASKNIDIGLASSLSSIKNLRIKSFGQGGAKSKKILQNLYLPKNDQFSSQEVLNGTYDAVIIIAGVNDVSAHVGKDFYVYHMVKIIEQLQHCGITPVLVTVPDFGIKETFGNRPWYKKLLKDLPSKILFDENLENPRISYVVALDEALKNKEGVIVISYEDFIFDYSKSKHLYANPSHLTKEGSIKLGEFIGRTLHAKMQPGHR